MNLDLLPDQPTTQTSNGDGGTSMLTAPGQPESNQIDLGMLKDQPRQLEWHAAGPENLASGLTAKEQEEFEGSVFDERVRQFTDGMMLDSYGAEGLAEIKKTEKKVNFFMSRAPRIALAFAAPYYALAYEVLDQGKNVIVSATKGEKYSPLETRMLSELLPKETPTPVKVASMLGETLVDVALVAGAMNTAKVGTFSSSMQTIAQKAKGAGYTVKGKDIIDKNGKIIFGRELKEKMSQWAKGTNIGDQIKLWVKAKLWKPSMHTSRQVGVKTPVNNTNVSVVRPPVNFKMEHAVRDISGKAVTKGLPQNIENIQEIALASKSATEFINKIVNMPAKDISVVREAVLKEAAKKTGVEFKDINVVKGGALAKTAFVEKYGQEKLDKVILASREIRQQMLTNIWNQTTEVEIANSISDPTDLLSMGPQPVVELTPQDKIFYMSEIMSEINTGDPGPQKEYKIKANKSRPQDFATAEEYVASKKLVEMAKATPNRFSDFESDMSGQTFYHGSAENFDTFDVNKVGKTHNSDFGKGIYLAKTESLATYYKNSAIKGTASKGVVNAFYIDPEAKVYKYQKESPRDISPGLGDKLVKEGYDAIYIYDELGNIEEALVLNPDVIYNKQQLTDIWNKATNKYLDRKKLGVNQQKEYKIKAIKRYLDGKKLGVKQQKVIDDMTDVMKTKKLRDAQMSEEDKLAQAPAMDPFASVEEGQNYKAVIEKSGAQFTGVQMGADKNPALIMFTDPKTGSTLTLKPGDFTPEAVRTKMEKSQKKFEEAGLKKKFNKAKAQKTPKPPKKKKMKMPKDLTPKRYSEPSVFKFITSQSRQAELLGLKKFVEPLEDAKLTRDAEIWTASNAIDHMVKTLTKGKKDGSTMSPGEMAVALNRRITTPRSMNEKEKAIFNYFRELTRDYLARQNEVLERMELEPIKDVGAYFRHVLDDTVKLAMRGEIALPEQIKAWSAKNITGKVFNPMEIERQIKDKMLNHFSQDLGSVMKSMVRVATKVIYFSEPKKILGEMLGVAQKDVKTYGKLSPEDKVIWEERWGTQQEMPAETKKWLEEYVKIVLLGEEQTGIDKLVNQLAKEGPIADTVNKVLGKFGKHLGDRAITDMLVGFSKLPLYGVIGGFRPKLLIRNKFQTIQNLALYGVQNTIRGLFPNTGHPVLQQLKEESLFFKSYSGIEGLPPDLKGKVKQAMMASFQWTAVSNVSSAMDSAYYWAAEKIQNPKWKADGWADPKRTYTEGKDTFYPSELARLKKEMEYGAHTTHYSYVAMGMPEIFRYRAGAAFTRLQSWWMNHWAVFHREAITRATRGHTGYDSNLKLGAGDRINYVKYLVLGGLVLNTMGYGRSYLLGTAPTGMPPSAQVAISLYAILTTDGSTQYGKNKKGEAIRSFKQAAMTFIPGYLTIKDTAALLSGSKHWTEYLFYKKNAANNNNNFRPK